MEHGNLKVLMQPAELIIIGGAAVGTVLVANPLHILKKIAAGCGVVLGGSKFGKQRYLESLKMMYDLLNKARKDGLVALEADIEDPAKSPILSKYAAFLKDHHIRDFVYDTMRMAVSGGVEPFDLDQMMESDMDVHHHDASQPVQALSTMADSLPGLGIVAACAGRGDHDGRPRRASGRNRTQGRRCTGRNIPGHPALLRSGRSGCRQHG